MDASDDDVVIIDSSSEGDEAPPPRVGTPQTWRFNGQGVTSAAQPPGSTRVADPSPAAAPPHSTAQDATCQSLREKLQSLAKNRVEADTQTDGCTDDEASEMVHRHLTQLDAALGIRVAAPSAKRQEERTALKKFATAWRAAAQSLKRPRSDPLHDTWSPSVESEKTEVEQTEKGGHSSDETALEIKVMKQERPAVADAAGTSPAVAAAPAWADEVKAALLACQSLLTSPAASAEGGVGEENGGDAACRARFKLAAPPSSPPTKVVSASPLLSQPIFHNSRAAIQDSLHGSTTPAVPPPAPKHNESLEAAFDEDTPSSSLLREAEVICAREHRSSLLPLYTELHALRKQNAQRQQQQAQSVSTELQWEQRLLTEMLTECETQLDFTHANFLESCRGGLAPLEALQRRLQTLDSFERQLRAAQTTAAAQAAPPSAATAAEAAAAPRSARAVGLAAEAVARHADAEQRRLQTDLAAARAELAVQEQRLADLQASYAHVTSQLQRSLDASDYVDRAAITALKQQQHEALGALTARLGWTLINSTPDVLSLRHPGTGEVLHANHTYSSINGRPCADVAEALAEYLVRHRAANPSPSAPAAVSASASMVEPDTAEKSSFSTSAEPADVTKTLVASEAAKKEESAPPAPFSLHDSDVANAPASATVEQPKDTSVGLPSYPSSSASHNEENSRHDDEADPAVETSDASSSEPGNAASEEQQEQEQTEEEVEMTEDEEDNVAISEAESTRGEDEENCSQSAESDDEEHETLSDTEAKGEGEEEGEDTEEEFVNYSNLQSDATPHSPSNASRVTDASKDAASAPAEDTASTNAYTGFFSENALWND